MEIILFWFLVSIAIGIWASNKGRSGLGWFVLAILISPILAAIFLAVSKDLSKPSTAQVASDIPSPSTHVTCPECAEYVRMEARVCKHCGCKLVPTKPEPEPQGGLGDLTPRQIVGIAIALLLAYVIFTGSQ